VLFSTSPHCHFQMILFGKNYLMFHTKRWRQNQINSSIISVSTYFGGFSTVL
jgi:hypothetical protein